MKKSALIIMMCVAGGVLSGEEYTIQTISALKESSITPAFENKVQKTALSSDKKKEGVCNIVTVGHYSDVKAAHANLKMAKTIAKDAFIRTVSREIPKVCATAGSEKGAASMVKADTNATAAEVKASEATATAPIKPLESTAMSDANCSKLPDSASIGSSSSSIHSTIIVYDRNLERKSDIHEAIEFYKNSPYHTFRPVAMQSSGIKGF